MDRRVALLNDTQLPDRLSGTALFADISGFTPLTEALTEAFGIQRGAEELTFHLNQVYDALIETLHQYGGSVISFAGDSITCWLTGDDGLRAIACALAMQARLTQYAEITLPSGVQFHLAMKTAVVQGTARRFLIGDPDIQLIDVLAGETLDRLAAVEQMAKQGETLVETAVYQTHQAHLTIQAISKSKDNSLQCAVVTGLTVDVPKRPWPEFNIGTFGFEKMKQWLLPTVYNRIRSGQGEFLAELRPAVVLFLRFGGIDYDNDPDAGDKLDQFVQQIQRILTTYGGSLMHITIGDKGSYLSASFGAPIAHEDDSLRAASAALNVKTAVQTLPQIKSLQIGIASGQLRAGAYGGTHRRTYGLMGDTVNLSARLMQAAENGQILATTEIVDATKENFEWKKLPKIKVKGKAKKIAVSSLQQAATHQQYHLQEPSYSLPMVGREAEVQRVQTLLNETVQGKGAILAITGEAGIGKSRLVTEANHYANRQNLSTFIGFCQSYATKSPYFVWQSVWGQLLGIRSGMETAQVEQTIRDYLGNIDRDLVQRYPLFSSILNVPIPDNELTASFDSELRKTSLESLLTDCVKAEAEKRPLLIILEDCHWLDDVSVDLLIEFGRVIRDLPILILMTYRPLNSLQNTRLTVQSLPYFVTVLLDEFTEAEAKKLIQLKLEGQFGETAVPTNLVKLIIERAGGNPFYIEELINYLQIQLASQDQFNNWERLSLPDSLHSLILSRIDQLTESQQGTIKVASVIGRFFKAAMLFGVYPQLTPGTEPEIRKDLDVLSALDLTPLDTPEPELAYLFKNVITQEVAYENLPFSTRSVIHGLIGNYIETAYPDDLSSYINILAHHYGLSKEDEKKREYLLKAAKVAQNNYANETAISYYKQAIPLIVDEEKPTVLIELGEVLQTVGEWPEAEAQFGHALTLATFLQNDADIAWAQAALGEHLRKLGQLDKSSEWLGKAQANFEAIDEVAGVGKVLHSAGTLAAQQGDSERSVQLFLQSLDIRRQLDDTLNIGRLLINLGILARRSGDHALAKQYYLEAMRIHEDAGNILELALALNNYGFMALQNGDYDVAREHLEQAIEHYKNIGTRWNMANVMNNLANVSREQQDFSDAKRQYFESLRINYQLGDSNAIAFLFEDMCLLAIAETNFERAFHLYLAAVKLRNETGSQLPDADRERLEQQIIDARQQLSSAQQERVLADVRQSALADMIDFALGEQIAA